MSTSPALSCRANDASSRPASTLPSVVLDSNVVFDWLVFGEPGVRPLADAVQAGDVRWLATSPMLDELAHVLARGVLDRWQPDAHRLLATCRQFALCCPAPTPHGEALRLRCRDADVQKFLDLALAEPATWLVTRDKALLSLARRARRSGLGIVTPEAWCSAWAQQTAEATRTAELAETRPP